MAADVSLPSAVAELVDELDAAAGVEAVVLGGSHAVGSADEHSDWDLGLYYRGPVVLDAVAARGEVHPPGSWGRLMNGGAWLDLDGFKVDVLLRDLDAVEHWSACARRGEYEVDAVLGYLAGMPTYTLTAEVASSTVLRGDLIVDGAFPEALAESAAARWGFQRDFTLRYARAHAARGNTVGVLGQLAKAATEEGHRRLCRSRRWVCNEKRLLVQAGVDLGNALTVGHHPTPENLASVVDAVEDRLTVSAP